MTTATEERKVVKVTGVYDRLAKALKPVVVCVGGAGSSKSYSMAQLIIQKLVEEESKVIGIGRKTFPALRMTAYPLTIGLLRDYGIYQYGEHNRTEHTFRYKDSLIQFFSLDDPEKIKSFNANYLWLEEANEFTWDDYLILKLRLNRSPGKNVNRIYLSLNPVDETLWIKQKLIESPEVEVIKSNYEDNPFLPGDYIELLRGLESLDPNYYRIYARGEWGRLENVIYTNWDLIDEMPYDFQFERYGVDFGYENPTVFLRIGITDMDLFIDELIYRTHMTNADLIRDLGDTPRLDIFADSSEPQRIEEICRAGINCYPAIKDVKLGIDTLKRFNIHITKRSVNVIKEIRSYARKKDRNGHVLEEPVKFNDHAMDALRYAIMGGKGTPEESLVTYDAMELVKGMDLS